MTVRLSIIVPALSAFGFVAGSQRVAHGLVGVAFGLQLRTRCSR